MNPPQSGTSLTEDAVQTIGGRNTRGDKSDSPGRRNEILNLDPTVSPKCGPALRSMRAARLRRGAGLLARDDAAASSAGRQPGRPSNPRRLPLPNKFLLTTITYCNMIIAYCDMAIHTARAIVIEAAKAPRFRPGAELPRGGTRTQKEYTP